MTSRGATRAPGRDAFVLSFDQSTAGTKALLFDAVGALVGRADRPHRQIVDERGWVSHDPEEILRNVFGTARDVLAMTGAAPADVVVVAVSNQRETAVAWDASTGRPVCDAVVWQCARGEGICRRLEADGHGDRVRATTGLPLSPYFTASKLAWILENVPAAQEAASRGTLRCGTMDSWLVYHLTGGAVFATDASNASRTQLMDLRILRWDPATCGAFGLSPDWLPEIRDSNARFGDTDLGGLLPARVPIHAVFGDSHGALYGQGCHAPGMAKATYGTGSSVMMNIGRTPAPGPSGLATSLAWSLDGVAEYVLEGNLNYTGAVMRWVVDDLKLLASSREAAAVAAMADPEDGTYLVPAFTGLGAPYWESSARAVLCGMGRRTGRAEIVRAAEDCIAYQIADVVRRMDEEGAVALTELRVDGGPTRDAYLMQFQSDLLGLPVQVPDTEELSGLGAAYAAGIAAGLYEGTVFDRIHRTTYVPGMTHELRKRKLAGWQAAVDLVVGDARRRKQEEHP